MPRDIRTFRKRAGASGLVVFFKAPSRAKRRLGARAEAAAERLLLCALEDARGWSGPIVLAAADDADADWLARTGLYTGEIIVQHAGSLGERINRVDAELRSRGLDRLIYIGADCPALDLVYLARADIALGRVDGVLGPAADGGVVLMGSRRPWPDIDKLAWSTPRLRSDLAERLEGRGWTIATLGTLRDVDEPGDLAVVAEDLAGDTRPARIALREWLRS